MNQMRAVGMSPIAIVTAVLTALPLSSPVLQQPPIAHLTTTAETSGLASTFEDVVKFMRAAAAASPSIYYTTYGTTVEGRAMPLAVVGTGLTDAGAPSVRATGKLPVHIQGNVHAGEVEGKEAAPPGGRGGRGRSGAPPVVAEPPQRPATTAPREWRTFEHVPRFHNNYVDLRNRFALLSEAHSYATFEDRIRVSPCLSVADDD